MTLLRVECLRVRFGGGAEALGGINVELDTGQSLAIVGESGAGKTTLARAIAGLLDRAEVHGSIRLDGRELVGMPEAQLRELRWLRLAYAPQGVPFNPLTRVMTQVSEPLRVHRGLSSKVAAARSRELASRVGLEPGLLERYPHQLSGGELRLALLAMALTCDPELIIMDEPSAGLDVLTASRFFERLHAAAQELESALIIISHDLPAATMVCSRTAVMYAGDIIEQGDTWRVIEAPAHPYSWALLNAYPVMSTSKDLRPIRGASPDPRNLPSGCRFHPRCSQAEDICRKERPPLEQHRGRLISCLLGGIQPLMRMQKVSKSYEVASGGRRQQQPAVREVSLEVLHGEVVGLIGPSGSGKSTIGRLASAVMTPDSGQVLLATGHLGRALPGSEGFRAESLARLSGRDLRQLRRQVQLIFQNPVEALNPRMRVLELVREALDIVGEGDRAERERAVIASLAQVGLDPTSGLLESYGHQLSGGQQQRVAIARALLVRPRLLIADEPTSMLDASEQARLLQLLKSLQVEQGMGMLLISHDIALVRKVADRIVILEDGTVVEEGPSGTVATNPASSLGRELVMASPAILGEHRYASERPPRIGAKEEQSA